MAKLNWSGDTSKGSPYHGLRQAGLSHNEAVAKLGMDEIDLAAEREGASIERSSEVRVKKHSKAPKIKPVDSRTLDESFDRHYGYGGYTARRED